MTLITSTESSNVLRNFVKVGISSIAYLRNLFAESVFEDTVIGGLQLKRLTRSIPESAALLDWIDHGVFDAMGHEYLKELVLSIHNSNNVALESYTFSLRYGNASSDESSGFNGGSAGVFVQQPVVGKSGDCGQAPCSMNATVDKEVVKQQTVKVLRDLVLLAQSLSPLPEHRYLSMRLLYYDDRVPQDYEPQYFRTSSSGDEVHVDSLNVEQQVGALETGHHNLSVDVVSCCYIDENVTTYKTSVRTFDTLTRRPAMSSIKPSVPPSLRNDSIDRMNGLSKPGGVVPDLHLPPLSGRRNCTQVSSMEGLTMNRNIILGLLQRGHEISMKTKYVSKEGLCTGLGIDSTLSKALLKKMLEYGYIDSRFVKGRGYPSRCYDTPLQVESTGSKGANRT